LPPSLLPRLGELHVDARMFGVAFAIAAATSLLFGILPALRLSRVDRLHAAGGRPGSAGRPASRTRAALVAGQLVMATVLLVGAGLLLRSVMKLSAVETGYDPANVLAFQLVFPPETSIARRADTIEAVLARLRAAPEVQAAGFTRAGILIPEEIHVGVFVPPGRTLDEMRTDLTRPRLRPVSRGYLTAMVRPLLDGRELAASDSATSPPVAVISRTVARRYFGPTSPVGQFVDWSVVNNVYPIQVVGVVEDIRNESPERDPSPDVFVEYR